METSLIEMAVDLVLSQSEQRLMTGADIADLLKQTYRALKEIQTVESGEGKLEDLHAVEKESSIGQEGVSSITAPAPVIDPSESLKSIKQDTIVCLECGKEFKQLAHTHLNKKHGLSNSDYRKKYGIPSEQPLLAKSGTEKRKKDAVEKETGKRLKEAREAKQAKK
jgi:predicted transcriptional regulator